MPSLNIMKVKTSKPAFSHMGAPKCVGLQFPKCFSKGVEEILSDAVQVEVPYKLHGHTTLHQTGTAIPGFRANWLPVVAGILHAGGRATMQHSREVEGMLVEVHHA